MAGSLEVKINRGQPTFSTQLQPILTHPKQAFRPIAGFDLSPALIGLG
jgi:hypothetical protein